MFGFITFYHCFSTLLRFSRFPKCRREHRKASTSRRSSSYEAAGWDEGAMILTDKAHTEYGLIIVVIACHCDYTLYFIMVMVFVIVLYFCCYYR